MLNTTETPQNDDNPISTEVIEQFLEVRGTGECNMFDRTCVQTVAFQLELYELVNWIEENKRKYSNLFSAVNQFLSNQD
jgi:hypothetical protein